MQDEVLEFIRRRFSKDCNWTTGNCYYFAIILKTRFPEGKIVYEAMDGHFIFKYKENYYDWYGIYNPVERKVFIHWDDFEEFDALWKQRIVRDCVM